MPKKPNRKVDRFGQFLAFDRKVLRFYGYWDDRRTADGILHNLELLYYLADDTIEIKEITYDCGIEKGSMFIRREKLPKVRNFLYFLHISGNPGTDKISMSSLKEPHQIGKYEDGSISP